MQVGFKQLSEGRGLFYLHAAHVLTKENLSGQKSNWPVGVGFGFTHEEALMQARASFQLRWPAISLDEPSTLEIGEPETICLKDWEEIGWPQEPYVRLILSAHGYRLDEGEKAQLEALLRERKYASALNHIRAIVLEQLMENLP